MSWKSELRAAFWSEIVTNDDLKSCPGMTLACFLIFAPLGFFTTILDVYKDAAPWWACVGFWCSFAPGFVAGIGMLLHGALSAHYAFFAIIDWLTEERK